jgi:glycosyltransferase involved in cell wall biosynthesis
MKILHGTVEIAGQAALSAHGLRETGYEAACFFTPHPFGYTLAPDFAPRGSHRVLRQLSRAWSFGRFAREYDVFHFHYGRTFLPEALKYLDAKVLKRAGRRVIVEFWGSDVRLPSVEMSRNPHYVNSYKEEDETNQARMREWAKVTDGNVIVSDHAFDAFLQPFFPHIHVVGQRIDTVQVQPVYPRRDAKVPVVVHAPSQREGKGTKFVRSAVERLKSRGLNFEYVEVHGRTQREAVEIYKRADLIVDQLCFGSHGVFAVEAMTLGKPVICYTLPELVPTYPDGFPLINANPDTFESVLEDWLHRPQDRHHLGVQSREYAERVHDCRVVASRLIDVYGQLGNGS